MLLSFSLRNFSSYQDSEYIDFRPSSIKKLREGVFHTFINPNDDSKKEYAYSTNAIFGANASGKSNLIFALRMLLSLIEKSATWQEGKKIPTYHPYKLCYESSTAPTRFELEFILSNIKYLYVVEYDRKSILYESLDFYPNGLKANLFKKEEGSDWKTIKFGKFYTGGMKQVPFFNNQSYLSVAGRSAGTPKILKDVYEFLIDNIFCISTHVPASYYKISESYEQLPALQEIASKFIPNIGISADKLFTKTIKSEDPEKDDRYEICIQRKDDLDNLIDFDYHDESDGTRHLIELLPLITISFLRPSVLVIDELDSSLHSELAILLIKIFNDPNLNKKGSQLIFTSHNLQLMDKEIFDKEQIWFADKVDKKTKIYSLSDFDSKTVTNDSPFRKWYMNGKFGALPEVNYSKISELIENIQNIVLEYKESKVVN
jgi:AAA15 family ATPase/GTPase